MAEDQFQSSGGGNWWESAARNNMRYESGGAPQSSSSGITNIGGGGGNSNNFVNWQQQQDVAAAEHMKATTRSSMDSSGGGGSSVVFHHHDPHKLHPPDHSSDPNLHMMGLGLSSPSSLDWDQPSLLRGGEKGSENSFRSMLQENLGSSKTNFQQDHHQSGGGMGLSPPQQFQWRDPSSTTNNNNNRGFSLDQNQFSPQYSPGESTITSQQGLHHHHHPSISSPFQNIDSSALYGSPSSILLQGLLGPDQNSNNQQANNNSMNFPFPSMSYGLSSNSGSDLVVPSNSWLNNSKASQFLRGFTPANNQLHFTNNAPFWNASESSAATIKDVRSTSFFPSLQPPFSNTPNFDVQSKNMSEVRDSGGVVKKSGCEQTAKRPRNETPSPLPAFKVRKEKMGDRITALQQLVSPFGKTDTASVLSEAIEYIKFLHEQVTVLSTPYIKSGAPIQQIQQSSGKSKEGEGPKQDLRSRGLCLVPVSSTFPVTHETTVDFWTPTFGGDSR